MNRKRLALKIQSAMLCCLLIFKPICAFAGEAAQNQTQNLSADIPAVDPAGVFDENFFPESGEEDLFEMEMLTEGWEDLFIEEETEVLTESSDPLLFDEEEVPGEDDGSGEDGLIIDEDDLYDETITEDAMGPGFPPECRCCLARDHARQRQSQRSCLTRGFSRHGLCGRRHPRSSGKAVWQKRDPARCGSDRVCLPL